MSLDNQPAGRREVIAERKVRALELRQAGHPYRKIAAELGVDVSTAHSDVKASLAELAVLEKNLAQNVRQLEIERLEMAVLAIEPAVRKGDLAAVDRWIRLSERRSRLLGLDAPTKTDVRVQDLDAAIEAELARVAGTEQSGTAGPAEADTTETPAT